MQEKDKYILVLGSKPDSNIPLIEVSHVYSANGAIEKALLYKRFFPKAKSISIIGGREFEKNIQVQNRVLDSNPDELISRSGNIRVKNYKFSDNMKYSFFSNFHQFVFQSVFFKKNFLDVLIKESYYEKKIIKKIYHMYRCIRHGSLTGVSTGFFSILYALRKHPNSEIILSGIGMSGGTHAYNDKDRYNKRSIVDKGLMLSLKKKYSSRLITTDINLSQYTNIKLWKKEIINEKQA